MSMPKFSQKAQAQKAQSDAFVKRMPSRSLGDMPGQRFARARSDNPPAPLARTAEFVEPDQSDLGSPVLFVKIFRFSHTPNHI
jgi:hypothetical protein